jgi:hypothetical protein
LPRCLRWRFGWGCWAFALLFHTAVNFWPAVVPVLPTETSYRAYALVVAILVMTALWLLATSRGADVNTGSP